MNLALDEIPIDRRWFDDTRQHMLSLAVATSFC